MTPHGIQVPDERLAALCRRYHIRKLSFFGSVLRDDFSPNSDVDVLVEFAPGRTPGLGFFGIERDLSEIFGRRVDLNTLHLLSRYFREQVEVEAVVQYVEA